MFRLLSTALFLLFTSNLAHASLVTNGGFETGDLTGWTEELGFRALVFCNNVRFTPHTGACALSLTNSPFEIFSQDIPTTPGASYDFDFWVQNTPGEGSAEEFYAYWDGMNVLSITGQTTAMAYTHHVFSQLIATGTSTRITFSGNGNTLRRWVIDDVNVEATAAPEPATFGYFAGLALFGIPLLRSRARR